MINEVSCFLNHVIYKKQLKSIIHLQQQLLNKTFSTYMSGLAVMTTDLTLVFQNLFQNTRLQLRFLLNHNEITSLARLLKKDNNEVTVSGICPREDNLNVKASDVNKILEQICLQYQLGFIEDE